MNLLKPKVRRLVRILAIPAALILVLSIVAIGTEKMALSYSGIAVDDTGRLYLGRGSGVEVYENGVKTQTVRLLADESYAVFSYENGQSVTVVISTDDASSEDNALPDHAAGQTLVAQRHSYTAPDGTVYTLRHEMLAAQVTAEDGTVLYSEPVWANALKPLLALAGLYVIFAAGYIALDRFATLEETGHLDQA